MGWISDWFFVVFIVGALGWVALLYVYSDGKMFLIVSNDAPREQKVRGLRLGISFAILMAVGVLAVFL